MRTEAIFLLFMPFFLLHEHKAWNMEVQLKLLKNGMYSVMFNHYYFKRVKLIILTIVGKIKNRVK